MAQTNWENLPSTSTPINATNLNKIEDYQKYSTTERQIGTWINNKPIYRKVFSGITLPSSLYQAFASVPNADTIVNSWGILYDGTSRIQFPFANPDFGTFLYYYFDSTNKVFKNVQSSNWFGGTVDFIVEYTKTTD